MFNIGMTELLLLLVIAFVVVGPQDLPKIARALGRLVRTFKAMVAEVKRETGLDEVAGELRDIGSELKRDLKSADVREDLKRAESELRSGVRSAQEAASSQGAASAQEAASAPREGGDAGEKP